MDDAGNSGFHLFFEKKMKIIRNKKIKSVFHGVFTQKYFYLKYFE